jgi:hypothetical protein
LLVGLLLLTAQVQMPDPRQVSGVPLPANDLPAGTVSVRVIRGSFANNLAGVDVDFLVDGKPTRIKTDEAGRAQIEGVRIGATLKAVTVVGSERLESQQITIGQGGVRFVLAATDPETVAREAEDRKLAAGPATKGAVVLGPGTRIIVEFTDDRLFLFYVVSILNTARVPVDIGGPLILELPTGARGASLLEDTSSQATVNGPRVTVTGPFAPGTTKVNVRFEMPYGGPTATIEQRWPAPLQQIEAFALKTGDLDMRSAQFASTQSTVQQGQALVVATGPALAVGAPLTIEVTGLPHHARWPRVLALSLGALIAAIGLWAAFVSAPRRPRERAA